MGGSRVELWTIIFLLIFVTILPRIIVSQDAWNDDNNSTSISARQKKVCKFILYLLNFTFYTLVAINSLFLIFSKYIFCGQVGFIQNYYYTSAF